MPQSIGDFAAGGGGRYLPRVLKSCPMKPSGVQFVRPIWPPDLQTRNSSAAACSWLGVNITPNVETTVSNELVRKRQGFGIGHFEFDRQSFGHGAGAAALEQAAHIVGRGDVAPAPGGGQADHSVAGSYIENLLAGPKIEGFAKFLAYNLQGRAHNGIVAGGPGGLLAGLYGNEVGRSGRRGLFGRLFGG